MVERDGLVEGRARVVRKFVLRANRVGERFANL